MSVRYDLNVPIQKLGTAVIELEHLEQTAFQRLQQVYLPLREFDVTWTLGDVHVVTESLVLARQAFYRLKELRDQRFLWRDKNGECAYPVCVVGEEKARAMVETDGRARNPNLRKGA